MITKQAFITKSKELNMYQDLFDTNEEMQFLAIKDIAYELCEIEFMELNTDFDNWQEARGSYKDTIFIIFPECSVPTGFTDESSEELDNLIALINDALKERENIIKKLQVA